MGNGAKPHDLEDRTFLFAESTRVFVKQLPRTNEKQYRHAGGVGRGSAGADANFFVDYLEERMIMSIFFCLLRIEPLPGIWKLGFGTSRRIK